MRIGHGYDVHRLVPDRPLVLGGVTVPSQFGTLGHSDGDAAIHALIDALYGALALGDIGGHFPDNDDRYLNIDSKQLLKACYSDVTEGGWHLVNADITIILQRPKLAGYIPAMRRAVADTLAVPVGDISIKATTEEHLGFTGDSSGVAAHAVVLLDRTAD